MLAGKLLDSKAYIVVISSRPTFLIIQFCATREFPHSDRHDGGAVSLCCQEFPTVAGRHVEGGTP